MTGRFTTIGLIGRYADPRVGGTFGKLAAHLLERGHGVLAGGVQPDDPAIAELKWISEHELAQRIDLLIAIGGDGTMLYASSLLTGFKVPLLGVNRGRLGFLADIGPDEMLERIDEMLAGEFVTESRMLLRADIASADSGECTGTALNDIVLQKYDVGRMLEFETLIDGNYVNTHGGDGFIVATPTGSTAYALSGGGPIMVPTLEALVMLPICPHTLSDRPIVIAPDREIELRLLERDQTSAQVTCDGRLLGAMAPGDTLRIRTRRERLTLLHPIGYDYYRILRKKLAWGRGRDRQPG